MADPDMEIWLYARPDRALPIEQRHAQVMARMAKVPPPLGFEGVVLPPAPSCGDALSAHYQVKMSTKGLRCFGDYRYRGERYVYEDRASFDEHIIYGFRHTNKKIDYHFLVHENLPLVIEAFGAYQTHLSPHYYGMNYMDVDRDNSPYRRLREQGVDVNGRGNIFTLYPAQFWDAELCQRALGYGPDEVMRRLSGKIPRVQPVLDGVYLVFNDDLNLTQEDFNAINDIYKPILGLS